MELAQRADAELIRALYAEHGQALFSYAMRLLDGDRRQAEDVVQETLLSACRHPEALRAGCGDVRPWLWTVARRLVVDCFRDRREHPSHAAGQLVAATPADDEIEYALLAWQVADALRSLTIDHRAVLVQTFYLGCSVAEAAEALDIPVATVKSRASYGLRELRLLLVEQGVTS